MTLNSDVSSTEQAVWKMSVEELNQFIDDLAAGLYKSCEPVDDQSYGDENYRTLLNDCGDKGLNLQSIQDVFLKYLNSGECKLQLGIGPECEQLRSIAMRGGPDFAWGKFVYPGMYDFGEAHRMQKLTLKCCKVHSTSFSRTLGGVKWNSHDLQFVSARDTTFVESVIRNVNPSKLVKDLYGGQCQRCEMVLHAPNGPIAEAAHIIEVQSDGPDEVSNLLCLCPNCHKTLDANAWAPKFEGSDLMAISYDNLEKNKVMILHDAHQVAHEAIDWRLRQFRAA